MLAAQNAARQERETNPYGFDGIRGEIIGTPKRERASVADTGLAMSTPDAFRLNRGTSPLEEKQTGITSAALMKGSPNKSRGYKMKGFGTKNK